MKRYLCLLMLVGCTSTIYDQPNVREARVDEVRNCTFVGRVRGIPGVYGPLKDIGLNDARRAAKEKAEEVGGNTVVFDPLPQNGDIYELRAQVYSC